MGEKINSAVSLFLLVPRPVGNLWSNDIKRKEKNIFMHIIGICVVGIQAATNYRMIPTKRSFQNE